MAEVTSTASLGITSPGIAATIAVVNPAQPGTIPATSAAMIAAIHVALDALPGGTAIPWGIGEVERLEHADFPRVVWEPQEWTWLPPDRAGGDPVCIGIIVDKYEAHIWGASLVACQTTLRNLMVAADSVATCFVRFSGGPAPKAEHGALLNRGCALVANVEIRSRVTETASVVVSPVTVKTINVLQLPSGDVDGGQIIQPIPT